MELKETEFYVLKGKKNYVYADEKEAIEQIKKNKDTQSSLVRVDISDDHWKLKPVGWDEIAKYLLS